MDFNFKELFKIFTNEYAQWTVLGAGHLSGDMQFFSQFQISMIL